MVLLLRGAFVLNTIQPKRIRLAKALSVYGAAIKAGGWAAGEPIIARFSEEFMDFREMAWAVGVVLRAEEIVEEGRE